MKEKERNDLSVLVKKMLSKPKKRLPQPKRYPSVSELAKKWRYDPKTQSIEAVKDD